MCIAVQQHAMVFSKQFRTKHCEIIYGTPEDDYAFSMLLFGQGNSLFNRGDFDAGKRELDSAIAYNWKVPCNATTRRPVNVSQCIVSCSHYEELLLSLEKMLNLICTCACSTPAFLTDYLAYNGRTKH